MKKILGLDLGTNSIGWALINQDIDNNQGKIIDAGSRIIPMSQEIIGEFDKGNSISQTAERTRFRGIRRLRERHLLRRERLHRVLNILEFLPKHYATQIDFEKHYGQFIDNTEPKLAYDEIGNFIFMNSFYEMLNDFANQQPTLIAEDRKVPYDWTIYYLRKKALTKKIEKEELAWLLLNFNQKRGYYQLRGEDDDERTDVKEYVKLLKIISIEKGEQDKKNNKKYWYKITLDNGWEYSATFSSDPLWLNSEKEFLVTEELDEKGNIKIIKDKKNDTEGKEKRRITPLPTFDEINLMSKKDQDKIYKKIKARTEITIINSNQTVGAYIYENLLKNPNQKVRGKLVRTIERKFYIDELKAILEKQKEFHHELQNETFYNSCLEELYKYNEAHKKSIGKKDFTHLFLNDIIFYQRPLKSKKSLISNCRYESRSYKKDDGTFGNEPIKCIAKSHPLFQEFRLWQWLKNLKIFLKVDDKDVTSEFLSSEDDWVNLFEWLNNRKEVDQKAFLKYPAFNLKKDSDKYRWNFVEDKSYPCNETHAQIKVRLSKIKNIPTDFLIKETEETLWHILYSVEDKHEIEKALKTFALKNNLGDDFVEQFIKYPRIDKEYGSYSAKAIKKLLPLMRMGKYWDEKNINPQIKERIDKIITGEYDNKIKNRVREKAINLTEINHFKGLPLWLACYIIYDRHSEEGEIKKWQTANDIKLLEQHSLRNPIVEQIINETLKVVKDIWKIYGEGKENFFDEIHIELGREMKNPADKRKQISNQNIENENTNLRIKALLAELFNDKNIENVRPYSPSQQELLKIYENGVLSAENDIPEDIIKIRKSTQPTSSELNRYKLWLEQKYRSPYTGFVIPLNKLFTSDYEIEHIIPQSRFFDDSLSNKVICEAEINKLKDNQLGLEFIKNHHGEKVSLNFGKTIEIFSEEEYIDFVKANYIKNRGKMKKLLLEDIPDKMIERQLNDTRYISKVVKNLLSNIVREEGEHETTSKNVLSSNGTITSVLKQDWGLNDIWNEIISHRFMRLNEMSNSKNFGEINPNTNKFLPKIPLELQKGFNKKRIDHRHHAMDALVIACATRKHINYLNNEYAKADKKDIRFDLRNKLRRIENIEINDKKTGARKKIQVAKEFLKPWQCFTEETKEILQTMLISFKQNLRVINKTVNNYQKWVKMDNGTIKKDIVKQTKGDNWAIRKPMHKDTVSGLVKIRSKKVVSLSVALDNAELIVEKKLKKIIKKLFSENYDKKKILNFFKETGNKWNEKNINKVEVYYWENANVSSRTNLDDTFNTDKIKTITDTGIQSILLHHLQNYDEIKNEKIIEHPELAFSPEGIEILNKNIQNHNNGKAHKAIYKVRTYEPKGNKFNVGIKGNKKDKYVEAAKGTNLFFAIYQDEQGKRSYDTIPLNIVIERQKQGLPSAPEKNEKGDSLFFNLSPNDLVYLPNKEEKENQILVNFKTLTKEQLNRIYKVVSFSGSQLFLIRNEIANSIINKFEFSALNKTEKSIEGIMIKDCCWKLKVDRLGKIKEVNGNKII